MGQNEYKPRRIHIIIRDEDNNINLKLPFFLTKAIMNVSGFVMEIADNSSMKAKERMALEMGISVLRIIGDIRITEPLTIVQIDDDESNVLIKLT